MEIKRRSFPMYVFLNCITLGIYGVIVSAQIGNEVDYLCDGDGEQPRYGYLGAAIFRAIPAMLGLAIGLIIALVATNSRLSSSMNAVIIFISMAVGGLIGSIVGSATSGLYLQYWWYRQAYRMKLNAPRYGLDIKESGTDTFLLRGPFELVLLPITVLLFLLAILIPSLLIGLFFNSNSEGAVVFGSFLIFLCSLPLMFCAQELTTGANFSMLFVIKNLNRFADINTAGGYTFDPMGYGMYPAVESLYPNFLPEMLEADEKSGSGADVPKTKGSEKSSNMVPPTRPGIVHKGYIVGLTGEYRDYKFEVEPGKKIVIGKDPSVANVIVNPSFKEVSRRHVSITFDPYLNKYKIVDDSTNGTIVNDQKLTKGQEVLVDNGSVIKLASDNNVFRLQNH